MLVRRASSSASMDGRRSGLGDWKRGARSRASGPHRGSRPGTARVSAFTINRWTAQCTMAARRWILWPRGSGPGTAVRVCSVWATASSMAVRDSQVPRLSRRKCWGSCESWCPWLRFTSRTTWRRLTRSPSGFPPFPRSPASTRAFIAVSRLSPKWFHCPARFAIPGTAVRLPRPVVRIHCLSAAASCAGDCRRPRDRRSPGKRRQSLCPEGPEER